MTHARAKFAALLCATLLSLPTLADTTPATAPVADAFPIYQKAAQLVKDNWDQQKLCSPANSNINYPGFPPFGDEWMTMEKADFDATADVRNLVHQAAAIDRAGWPAFAYDPARQDANTNYLNNCRSVCNEIRDAALYQSLTLHDEPAALQSVGDLLHMADLLNHQPGIVLIRDLVAIGITAADMYSLEVIVSGAPLTDDPKNLHDISPELAKAWITRLLDHPDAAAQFDRDMDGEFAIAQKQNPLFKTKADYLASELIEPHAKRLMETFRRVNAERDMAAMSLASHVYQFKHNRWPATLDELATELPRLPIDPWGDGKQTLGYVLIQHGMPDGSDRPLVFSRSRSNDGLFYRIDEPQYGFYTSDGSKTSQKDQKQGGQFRDVARWIPSPADGANLPTTRPLK